MKEINGTPEFYFLHFHGIKGMIMTKLLQLHSLLFLLISGCSSPKTAQSLMDPSILNGTWEVTEMPVSSIAFNELFPQKRPTIHFDTATQKITGSTGCNTFNGPYTATSSTIDFSAPLGMTRMMCPGEGETTFLTTLQKANGWTVREETLRLMTGDLVVMHLHRVSGK
jgi:heat shock protein HslJ